MARLNAAWMSGSTEGRLPYRSLVPAWLSSLLARCGGPVAVLALALLFSQWSEHIAEPSGLFAWGAILLGAATAFKRSADAGSAVAKVAQPASPRPALPVFGASVAHTGKG